MKEKKLVLKKYKISLWCKAVLFMVLYMSCSLYFNSSELPANFIAEKNIVSKFSDSIYGLIIVLIMVVGSFFIRFEITKDSFKSYVKGLPENWYKKSTIQFDTLGHIDDASFFFVPLIILIDKEGALKRFSFISFHIKDYKDLLKEVVLRACPETKIHPGIYRILKTTPEEIKKEKTDFI